MLIAPKAFPEDFPDYVPSESDDDAKLDEIIETIRDLFEEHIKEITEEDEEPSDEDFMKKIADQAQLVLAATHTIEDVVDQLDCIHCETKMPEKKGNSRTKQINQFLYRTWPLSYIMSHKFSKLYILIE